MTSSVSQASRRQFQKLQEDSAQFTTQQKWDPLFLFGRLRDTFGRPFVSRRFCQHIKHPSGLQGNTVRTLSSVREESKLPFQTRIGKQLATVQMLGQHCQDATLIRKAWSAVWKAVVVICPDALSFRPIPT